MKFCSLFAVIFFLMFSSAGVRFVAAEEARLPQAANGSDFSYTVFTNLTFNSPASGMATLAADDLGIFGSAHINPTLNPFLESEIAGLTLFRQGGDTLAAGYPHFLLERLFNDSYLNGNLTLRIGKMLSPVGEWNLVHVPPLVLTVTRPMTTFRGFSEFASGMSLLYNGTKGSLPDIQVYVQPGAEFHSRPKDIIVREYRGVSGFHLNWSSGLEDKFGVSLQHAKIKNTGEQQTLYGFNVTQGFGSLELETEAFYTRIGGEKVTRLRDGERGGYLQGIYSFNERWSGVGRYEYFSDRGFSSASSNALFGVAYKPASVSPKVWKLEYVKQYGQQLDIRTGLYAAFSALF